MRALKQVIVGFLTVAIIASGLPCFSPEDASRDGQVDLRDAILLVKNFAASATEPDTFSSSLQQMHNAISVVAGLKKVVSMDNDQQSSDSQSITIYPDLSYLLAAFDFTFTPIAGTQTFEQTFAYQSLELPPASPPPRFS